MNKPFFSVLVPVYNMQGKMDECINSLLGQSFSDFEVIMVNDGSSDESLKMIQEFAEHDDRFIALSHEENKSLLAARYTGMAQAKGDYVFFLDSDDYLEGDTFEYIFNYVKENPVDIVRFGYIIEPQKTEMLPPKTDDPLKYFLEGSMTPNVWKNCYSSEVIRKTIETSDAFRCNMGEDVFLSGVLFSNAESIGVIDKVFHHYILGTGMSTTSSNMTEKKIKMDTESVYQSGEHLLNYIEKYNPTYLDEASHAVRTMRRFVLMQAIMGDPDYKSVIRKIELFHKEEYKEIYEWGCNSLLRAKFLYDMCKTDEAFKKITPPDLRAVLVEDQFTEAL